LLENPVVFSGTKQKSPASSGSRAVKTCFDPDIKRTENAVTPLETVRWHSDFYTFCPPENCTKACSLLCPQCTYLEG
jgi:hypothetical protein